jgi:hypothetical protein
MGYLIQGMKISSTGGNNDVPNLLDNQDIYIGNQVCNQSGLQIHIRCFRSNL